MKILCLIPSTLGYGEANIALNFLNRLDHKQHEVEIVASGTLRSLLDSSDYRTYWILPQLHELNRLLFFDVIAEFKPDCLLLCDFLAYQFSIEDFGLSDEQVISLNMPILSFDLYGWSQSNFAVDSFKRRREVSRILFDRIDFHIRPCPFNRLPASNELRGKTLSYSFVPKSSNSTRMEKRHLRETIGCPDEKKLVFFTTAIWQHRLLNYPWTRGVLDLLVSYFQDMDNCIHLVHVGPERLFEETSQIGSAYTWIPMCPPYRFNKLLAASDLYLSLNIIANTLSKAIAYHVPSLFFSNSYDFPTRTSINNDTSDFLDGNHGENLKSYVPIHPYMVWPLGWHEFLTPLFRNNEYTSTFETAEILNRKQVLAAIRNCLYDDDFRDRMSKRQERYLSQLKQLHEPTQLLTVITEGIKL